MWQEMFNRSRLFHARESGTGRQDGGSKTDYLSRKKALDGSATAPG